MKIDIPEIQAAAKHLIEVKNDASPDTFETVFNAIRAFRKLVTPEVILALCAICVLGLEAARELEDEDDDKHTA